MLRKLLGILCLMTITPLSQCMYNINNKIQPSAPSIEELGYISYIYPSPVTEDPIIKFNDLLKQRNQQNIIAFLKEYHSFHKENKSSIIDQAFRLNLVQVLNYIRETFTNEDQDLVRGALRAGNIVWIKEFTKFDNYVDQHHDILDGQRYLDENVSKLGESPFASMVLHEIIIYNGINYKDTTGSRYLQTAIRSRQNHDVVIRFIKTASPAELNTQETDTGSTALHEAALAWKDCSDRQNELQMQHHENMIKALLEHGANPVINNNHKIRPSDLTFFEIYQTQYLQWQANYQRSKILNFSRSHIAPQSLELLTSSKNTLSKKSKDSISILKLTGFALAGALTFYLGYKILGTSHANHLVKLT